MEWFLILTVGPPLVLSVVNRAHRRNPGEHLVTGPRQRRRRIPPIRTCVTAIPDWRREPVAYEDVIVD